MPDERDAKRSGSDSTAEAGSADPDSRASDRSSAAEVSASGRQEYWRANLRAMAILLTIWFMVSFGLGILFVERLNAFHVGGFPLGFWFAQQGSIYVFVLLIFVYARWMDRIDARFGVD